jgi:hypothetical protein
LGPVKVVSARTVPISVAFGPIGEREARSQNRTVPSAPPEISVTEQALDTDTRATNCLVRELRAFGERIAAELKERWRTLKRVTLSPSRIGDIARAALALNRHWK